MDRDTAQGVRRRRCWTALAVIVAVAAILAIAARPAAALESYMHGGIVACTACHQDDHSNWPPTNSKCLTCHGDYDVADVTLTCWTCHTPGQGMGGARSDAACTTACHLVDGTSVTHVAHADKPSTCTSCHPLSASITQAAGSPHHTFSPPVPTQAGFLPSSGVVGSSVTVTGTGFVRVLSVTFNGVAAAWFRADSEAQVTVTVPAGATTGPIAVTTVGGVATSATPFTVLSAQAPPAVALIYPLSGFAGSKVTVTGAGFAGATSVSFSGTAAAFALLSDAQLTATVPAGAVTGAIIVAGPGGTGTSASAFTVLTVVTSNVTLKLSRSTVALGRSVKATGVLSPLSLAGGAVKLTVQRKRSGVWRTVKRVWAPTGESGAYAWTYKPGRRGPYRVRASVAATATRTAARTKWVAFSVK